MRLKTAYFGLTIFILIIGLFGCESTDQRAKTIEEALKKAEVSYYEILHQEVIENGKIIFFKSHSNLEDEMVLGIAFVQGDGVSGWDLIYNDVNHTLNKNMTMNDVILPEEFNTSDNHKDIVYGVIQNPEIETVYVRTRGGSLVDGSFQKAKKIQSNWKEIYFYLREELQRTQVIGFSKDGEEISNQG